MCSSRKQVFAKKKFLDKVSYPATLGWISSEDCVYFLVFQGNIGSNHGKKGQARDKVSTVVDPTGLSTRPTI